MKKAPRLQRGAFCWSSDGELDGHSAEVGLLDATQTRDVLPEAEALSQGVLLAELAELLGTAAATQGSLHQSVSLRLDLLGRLRVLDSLGVGLGELGFERVAATLLERVGSERLLAAEGLLSTGLARTESGLETGHKRVATTSGTGSAHTGDSSLLAELLLSEGLLPTETATLHEDLSRHALKLGVDVALALAGLLGLLRSASLLRPAAAASRGSAAATALLAAAAAAFVAAAASAFTGLVAAHLGQLLLEILDLFVEILDLFALTRLFALFALPGLLAFAWLLAITLDVDFVLRILWLFGVVRFLGFARLFGFSSLFRIGCAGSLVLGRTFVRLRLLPLRLRPLRTTTTASLTHSTSHSSFLLCSRQVRHILPPAPRSCIEHL